MTGLPITSVYQVVADTAHGHLFISQGPDAGTDAPIVVTNLSGTPITTIGDGARGLALSANDETLYAAIGDTVTAFSTTTLKQTASYPTPGTAWQVALQSGRLWVSYQDDSAGEIGAKVSAALSGYYKTAKVSGLDEHVYHHTAAFKDLVTVAPDKPGECVRLQVQQASGSVWRADATTGRATLNKWSQAMMARKLGATGWFRVRADFTPSAKDTANVSTDGSWVYYEVTR